MRRTVLYAITALCFIFSISMLLSMDSAAATHKVDDEAEDGGDGSQGRPFNKIQDAVNAADNGDVIKVQTGEYHENIVVDKSLTIEGPLIGTAEIRGGDGTAPRWGRRRQSPGSTASAGRRGTRSTGPDGRRRRRRPSPSPH